VPDLSIICCTGRLFRHHSYLYHRDVNSLIECGKPLYRPTDTTISNTSGCWGYRRSV